MTTEEQEQEREMTLIEQETERLEAIVGSPALAKACQDDFDFALGLRSGQILRFTSTEVLNKEWVKLSLSNSRELVIGIPYPCPRGVDVRISDIMWVADAPEGS